MITKLLNLPPRVLQAAGMAFVALILLGSSFAFGLFGDIYDMNEPYDQLYPTSLPRDTAP